jgi:hypothetical protein
VLGLPGSPSDGGTAHIQPARAGDAASAAAGTITVKYKDHEESDQRHHLAVAEFGRGRYRRPTRGLL